MKHERSFSICSGPLNPWSQFFSEFLLLVITLDSTLASRFHWSGTPSWGQRHETDANNRQIPTTAPEPFGDPQVLAVPGHERHATGQTERLSTYPPDGVPGVESRRRG